MKTNRKNASFRVTLYTEDMQRDLLLIMSQDFFPDGCTFTASKGFWEGTLEDSVAISVVGGADLEERAIAFAKKINALNNQDACMITCEPVTAWMITDIER